MPNNERGDTMKVRSFSHVGLTVWDLKRSCKWYNETFGFSIVSDQSLSKEEVEKLNKLYRLKDTGVKFALLRCPKGGVIEMFQFDTAMKGAGATWNKVGLTHLALDVKNVPKWYKELKSKGVEFLCEPQYTAGTCWVFLKDPDGNLIELMDLKAQYFLLKKLGGIAAYFMKKKKYRGYY